MDVAGELPGEFPTRGEGEAGPVFVGAFYDSNRFDTVTGGTATSNGNYGVYAMAQQKIYQEADTPGQQGLTVWGTACYSTKQNVSLLPLFTGAASPIRD